MRTYKKPVEDKQLALTFYSKQKVRCPVCDTEFQKEELLSGSGRLIAGNLTDELRREFEPSKKFGVVYPLIYAVGTCPTCYLSLLWNDFNILTREGAKRIEDLSNDRYEATQVVFPHFDFHRNRTILDGAAAYYMALQCYELVKKDLSPTMKRAMLSLRLAWICGDMDGLVPGRNYSFIQQSLYKKALFFYGEAMRSETNGTERITNIGSYGPDIDKNYGFDGVVYLNSLLEYKFGQRLDMEVRIKTLEDDKRSLARMFGLGKSSKNKPGPLLELARNLYDNLKNEIRDITGEETEDDDE